MILHHRRTLALGATITLICGGLVACSDDDSSDASGATRHITSEAGETDIPVDPEMIVAVDEPAALNMLSIGVTPDVVFNSWRTTVPVEIFKDLGIKVAETSSFVPETEEVAQYKPDLIVGTWAEGWSQAGPKYAEIAPMIGGMYQGHDGSEIIHAYGEYFDRKDEAAKVADALDSLTTKVADSQEGDPKSLSVLMSYAQQSGPIYMDGDNTLTQTISGAGFTRPKLQATAPEGGSVYGGWTMMSPEDIKQHDADIIAIAVAAQYNREGVTDVPEFSRLQGVKDGHTVDVDGDMWSGGSAFYTYWVLRDLQNFTSGDLKPGTTDDAQARWDDYLAAIK